LLAEKRGLYEQYRQLANVFEDAELQALLRQLLHEEEVHQDQIVELIVKVDSHVHTA
jgi:rubrerythrin